MSIKNNCCFTNIPKTTYLLKSLIKRMFLEISAVSRKYQPRNSRFSYTYHAYGHIVL